MAGSTRYYGLGFFDFGDPLGTDFAAQIEIDRFVFIDKQLFGLMSIFGNGVIEGWDTSIIGAFDVAIGEGSGNINFIAGRTEFPVEITDLPPNSLSYVYARVKRRTTFAEDVDFFISPDGGLVDPNFLLISRIITGATGIESIDDSVRHNIGFIDLIRAAIRDHKHRGGTQNPSKIDLSSEVKGQLPAFRVADFDAEKLVTGTLELGRIPLLDHQELANVGLLTHPQLDTFVKTLEANNKEIFGEIGLSNILQMLIAMKLIYDDPDSGFYLSDRTVDENMINEIIVIPGITTDDYIDFDATTAEVNLEQHYIAGVPPTTGTSFYVTWNTDLAWNSAYVREDVVIVSDTVSLAFNDSDESNIVTIEGFETATEPGQSLTTTSGGGQQLFEKQSVITSDQADITANAVALDVLEGFYSGRFTHRQDFRVQYVKEFNTSQDWSTYDSFVLWTKCLDSIHGPVKIFFFDQQQNKSAEFTVLADGEVTDNTDPSANNFEMRMVDIGQIPFRTEVKGFVIYSDDTDNPFSFYIDHITIQRSILLPEDGRIVLRYATSSQVTFSQIEWTSIEPAGTEIRVRSRSANGTAFLNRADYTPYLISGDLVNLEGTDLEIEIELFPDDDRLVSPILQSVRVLVLTEAELDGYAIDSDEEWSLGDADNITVSDDTLTLTTPIYVDSYYFAVGNLINQIYEQTSSSGNQYVTSEFAISGTNSSTSPIAPNLIFKAVETDLDAARVTTPDFFSPRSIIREDDRHFIIADTYNDRVLEVEEDGTLIAGFGSINYEHSSKIFPLSASLDPRTSILYVVWSKKISFKTVDVRKITLQNGTQSVQIQLITDFDKILGLTTAELDQVNAEGQVMPIHLSLQNAGLAQSLTAEDSYMLMGDEVLSSGLDTDSVYYRAIVTTSGIPLFVGNFAYIDGVFSPTYAHKTDDDTYVVANATVAVKEFDITGLQDESISLNTNVSSIIEVDENNNVIYGTDKVLFSPFVPGRAERLDSTTMLIAGMKPTGQESEASGFDFREIAGDSQEKVRRKDVLNDVFFGSSSPLSGTVIVLDTQTGDTSFEYSSPEGILASDVDIDTSSGNYVIAESSFKKSGRIIKVDTVGNIVFSFGEGLYGVINDVTVQVDGSMVVST
jgi:hypothetical protein